MNTAPLRLFLESSSVAALAEELTRFVSGGRADDAIRVGELALQLLDAVDQNLFKQYSDLINRACFFLFEVGQSSKGIALGRRIAFKAEGFDDIQTQRRVFNIIGGQYADIADFASAMQYLEKAVVLARRIGDSIVECACLANITAVLQEMGHYRQAMLMANRVLALQDDALPVRNMKVQCASNGLFAAHRIGNLSAAKSYLEQGEQYLSAEIEPFRRVFFERGRTLFLIESGDAVKASTFLEETATATSSASTPRIETLLAIARALCQWALGHVDEGRESLTVLYRATRQSRLYHHFVLQALVKVYSDALTPAEASLGMGYARELVEFTTSVKKAKFYRQLANKREDSVQSHSHLSTTTLDSFESVRDWLSSSEIRTPPEDGNERRELAKHEELTAIHEDMARLRALSIRRDIRTDAVDTAENWAIAAEFFDDETGQHCYRVGHLASMLAREVGMDETFSVQVEHAARLHDIGKIAVNEVILLKPGPLDAAEMAAMRLHTEVGAQILSGSDDPTLRMATEIARHHHEWWNGAGYPTKIAGKDIPLSARICAYADVYDALTHMRAYKKAWTHERAVAEIVRLGGAQFDPELLAPFLAVLERYRSDLDNCAIPGFADMDSNALIASRKKLMETIGASTR